MSVPILNYGDVQSGNSINTNLIQLNNAASDPDSIGIGSVYYNTGSSRLTVDTGGEGFSTVPIYGDSISNFVAPTSDFSLNSHLLTGVADAVNGGNAVNFVTLKAFFSYGGTQYSTGASAQALTGGAALTQLAPDGTWNSMASSNFVTANNALTFVQPPHGTITNYEFMVTVMGFISEDYTGANNITMALYVNGSLYFNPVVIPTTSQGVIPINFQMAVSMNPEDVVSVYVGTSQTCNLTTEALSLTAQCIGVPT